MMDDAPYPRLSFVLPMVTPLLNTIHRQHWATRRKATVQLAGLVRLLTHGRRPREPFEFAHIEVIRYSLRVPDYDNMVGGVKSLIDCLQPPGAPFKTGPVGGPYKWACKHPYGLSVIRHDGPDCILLCVTHAKAASRVAQGTHVTITSVSAATFNLGAQPCSPVRTI